LKVVDSILDLVGGTPLIRINGLNKKKKVNIFAKFEGANPTGSIKDRAALKMIEEAEAVGKLSPGKVIIEATSGNTGIALAMVGAVKGYTVQIVMSSAVSEERRKMIKAFGADVILTDPDRGTDGAILKCHDIVALDPEKYYCPDQFSNSNNLIAHYENTARELYDQMDGKIDYLVAALGTSGTLMGIAKYLKEIDSAIKIVSAEPVKGHYIQGLKNMEEAIVPAIYDKTLLDEIVMVETEDAFQMAREIVLKEGIFSGMSSGAALWAALKKRDEIESGNIVVIFPDRGERYLSTELFQV